MTMTDLLELIRPHLRGQETPEQVIEHLAKTGQVRPLPEGGYAVRPPAQNVEGIPMALEGHAVAWRIDLRWGRRGPTIIRKYTGHDIPGCDRCGLLRRDAERTERAAAAAGQSVQQYLRQEAAREAAIEAELASRLGPAKPPAWEDSWPENDPRYAR